MMSSIEQQIFDRLNKAKRILIALPQKASGDAVGAGLALFDFLKKLEKEPEIVCVALNELKSLSFLPQYPEIKNTLKTYQSFVVTLNTKEVKLDELSYEAKEQRVDIFLKPKNGKFTETDLSFSQARFPYDLIVTLDTPMLENLGELYEKNRDLFFETPILNIDHQPANEHYGEINLVDLAATSTSEILAILIEDFEAGLIDENIATNLLTGIVIETNSFQHVKTTPKAFLRASSLIAKGGKHQEIIRELFKTKNISLLKLWGRALARVREIKELGLVYSLLAWSDLMKAGSGSQEILEVMKELVGNLSGRKIVMLLAEIAPQEIICYYHLHPTIKSQVLSSALGGQMLNGALGMFRLKERKLLEVEQEVLEKLEKIKEQIAL